MITAVPLVQVLYSLRRNVLFVIKVAKEGGMQLMKVKFAEQELSVCLDQWTIPITYTNDVLRGSNATGGDTQANTVFKEATLIQCL